MSKLCCVTLVRHLGSPHVSPSSRGCLDFLIFPAMGWGSLPTLQSFIFLCAVLLLVPDDRPRLPFALTSSRMAPALCSSAPACRWSRDHKLWQHVYEFRCYMVLVLVLLTFTLVGFKLFSLDVPSRWNHWFGIWSHTGLVCWLSRVS